MELAATDQKTTYSLILRDPAAPSYEPGRDFEDCRGDLQDCINALEDLLEENDFGPAGAREFARNMRLDNPVQINDHTVVILRTNI